MRNVMFRGGGRAGRTKGLALGITQTDTQARRWTTRIQEEALFAGFRAHRTPKSGLVLDGVTTFPRGSRADRPAIGRTINLILRGGAERRTEGGEE